MLNSAGIFPVSWFEFRIKSWRFSSFLMDEGIEPTSEFELRSMTCSSVQSPMSDGIVPVRLAPEITSF